MNNSQPTRQQSAESLQAPVWRMILAINQFARTSPKPQKSITVLWNRNHWQVTPDIPPREIPPKAIMIWLGKECIEQINHPTFGWDGGYTVEATPLAKTFDTAGLCQQYLGYALLPWQATTEQRCITVAHFAQSLDGKIATSTGHSRWIGNDENLLHAHRMRALCQGILIGKGTLVSDDPALTTRHVEGPNPQRIVVSSTPCNFDSLIKSSQEEIWWIGGKMASEHVRCIEVPPSPQHTRCERLLETLFNNGIKTVFIEGGSVTTSAFLSESMIDIMQFHISPLVFGSGIPGINLPEITEVGESVKFDSWKFFPVGDAVMFVGKPAPHDA